MAVASHFWNPSLATPAKWFTTSLPVVDLGLQLHSKPPPCPPQDERQPHQPYSTHSSFLPFTAHPASEQQPQLERRNITLLHGRPSFPVSAIPQPLISATTTALADRTKSHPVREMFTSSSMPCQPFHVPYPQGQRALVSNSINAIPQQPTRLDSHADEVSPASVPNSSPGLRGQPSAEAAIAEFSSIVTFYLLHGNLHFPDVTSHLSPINQQRNYEGGIQSLYLYCLDVLTTSKVSGVIVLLSLKYVDRLISLDPKRSTGITDASRPGAASNLFAVCLMLAAKMLDDNCYDTRTWSTIVKLPIRELIKWESRALGALRFDVNVSGAEYSQWLHEIDDLAVRIGDKREKRLHEESERKRRAKAAQMHALELMQEQADTYRRFHMEDQYRTMLLTAETYGRDFNPRVLRSPAFSGPVPYASPVSSSPSYCPVYTANSYPPIHAGTPIPTIGFAAPLQHPNPRRYHTQDLHTQHFFASSKEPHNEPGFPPPRPLYEHHQLRNHHPLYPMT